MKKQIFISITLILICCFTQINSIACKCALQTFHIESENADLIFKGIVVNKKDSPSIYKVFYTFKVTGVWKGVTFKDLTIATYNSGPSCGTSFDLNKEYVIYSSKLMTGKCRRNAEASTSADVARLNFKYIGLYKQNIANDSFPILSKQEGDYLNAFAEGLFIHGDNPYTINFTQKKIAFLDTVLISKKEFFKRYGEGNATNSFEKFSAKEIKDSGGFYGIYSLKSKKPLSRRQKKKLIQQLRL